MLEGDSVKDKLHLLFVSSRPISWVNTAYPFAAGYLVLGGGVDLTFIIGTIFFLIPYNLLMYGVNDVFDYESDMRNPRKGGIEGAVTAKRYHALILWTSTLLCVPFVVTLLIHGTTVANVTLALVLFFVVAYSARGLRFKEIPFLDSITSSLHFVGPLLYAFALLGSSADAWLAAGAFFVWGVASQAFGAVQDVQPDREAGIHSIATVLGARWTVRFAASMYLLACILTARMGGWAIVVAVAGLSYVANVWPYLGLSDATAGTARAGWRRFIWINYVIGAIVTMSLLAGTGVFPGQ